MNKKNIIISIIVLLILGVLGIIALGLRGPSVPPTKYADFAQCLASKKLTMYGAVWCTHCKAEKALFGESFKYVPYVECTEDANLCLAKGIEGYPTWIDANGVKYTGEQSLEKLSEISGCELPAN
ncbi:MAG: hypothetical protein PHS95_02930 [Candidatus Pacebacteria bacterium]|nr:hypothetical protein [Candidatus Paceibacterota bacterium]